MDDLSTNSTVLKRIRDLLDSAAIPYREVTHGPTRTSEEAARARGESLSIGGKALVLKVDEEFGLYVLCADRRLDSGAIRKALGARRTRFATPEELQELTGLKPGSVPPFGPPVLALPLRVDRGVLENDKIAFNAGSLEHSIVMGRADWQEVARPVEVLDFSR